MFDITVRKKAIYVTLKQNYVITSENNIKFKFKLLTISIYLRFQ